MTLSRGSALRPRTSPLAPAPVAPDLAEDAYQVLLAAQTAALEAAVRAFIDAHPSLEEAERDRRIRAEVVRPHVLSYNRGAPLDRRLPEERAVRDAVRDLFNRLCGSYVYGSPSLTPRRSPLIVPRPVGCQPTSRLRRA